MLKHLTFKVFLTIILYGMSEFSYSYFSEASGIGTNPAFLGRNQKGDFSYQVLGASLALENNAFTGTVYNRYNGDYWDEKEKLTLLSLIPKDGLLARGNAEIKGVGFTYGPLRISVQNIAKIRGELGKEEIDLILFGNKVARCYQLGHFKGVVLCYLDILSSIGFSIKKNWFLGFSLRCLSGYYFEEYSFLDGYLLTDRDYLNASGNLAYRKSEGGKGWGIDYGIVYQKERWYFSFLLNNLNTGISWDVNSKEGRINFKIDSLNWGKIRENNYYYYAKNERAVNVFLSPLPMVFKLEGGVKLKNSLILTKGIEKVMSEGFSIKTGICYKKRNWLFVQSSLKYEILKNLFASTSKAFHTGLGLGFQFGRFSFYFSHHYINGLFLGAKGFRIDTGFGFNLFKNGAL